MPSSLKTPKLKARGLKGALHSRCGCRWELGIRSFNWTSRSALPETHNYRHASKQMLTFSNVLAVIALLISTGALSVSVFNYRRASARLRVTCMRYSCGGPEYGDPYIEVHVVNAGRRPVVLRKIGGSVGDHWSATCIDFDAGGRRLGEHEHYQHKFRAIDLTSITPESEEFIFNELWVEDSLGVRHRVQKSRENIQKLLAEAD